MSNSITLSWDLLLHTSHGTSRVIYWVVFHCGVYVQPLSSGFYFIIADWAWSTAITLLLYSTVPEELSTSFRSRGWSAPYRFKRDGQYEENKQYVIRRQGKKTTVSNRTLFNHHWPELCQGLATQDNWLGFLVIKLSQRHKNCPIGQTFSFNGDSAITRITLEDTGRVKHSLYEVLKNLEMIPSVA